MPAQQVRKGNLVQLVKRVLDNTGLDAHLLDLELTESCLMDDGDDVLEMMRELRAMGVRISLDDFGTGYSSLSYLKRFPIDTLKIDQAFVRDIGNNPDDEAIARAIAEHANRNRTARCCNAATAPRSRGVRRLVLARRLGLDRGGCERL